MPSGNHLQRCNVLLILGDRLSISPRRVPNQENFTLVFGIPSSNFSPYISRFISLSKHAFPPNNSTNTIPSQCSTHPLLTPTQVTLVWHKEPDIQGVHFDERGGGWGSFKVKNDPLKASMLSLDNSTRNTLTTPTLW